MKYQKCYKKDLLFEAKMLLGAGLILFAAGTLPQHFFIVTNDMGIWALCLFGEMFFIISLIFLFIARHKERKYKLTRTIDKMLGIDTKAGRLTRGIHLPYVPGSGFPRKY